ncbi:MAG: hypothetical protein IKZ13_10485 [Akkermansia sp.]|nr:hypothetical protein [Akkermansia sp.]
MKKLIIIAMLAVLPAVAQAAPHHAPQRKHAAPSCHHAKPAPRPKPHHHHKVCPPRLHAPHCVVPAPRPCPPPPPVHHCNRGSNFSISISL